MRQIYKGSFLTKRSAKENLCEANKDSITYLTHCEAIKQALASLQLLGRAPTILIWREYYIFFTLVLGD